MFKSLVVAAIVMAGSSIAMAAPAKATVASVQGKTLVIKVEGQAPAWMKKGQAVRINKQFNGKITAVEGEQVTLTSPKASELKAGEGIAFDKGLAAAGC